ncbi:hypothetical protein DFJ77DRAFT_480055, partial [Powellomyces hirtus]
MRMRKRKKFILHLVVPVTWSCATCVRHCDTIYNSLPHCLIDIAQPAFIHPSIIDTVFRSLTPSLSLSPQGACPISYLM